MRQASSAERKGLNAMNLFRMKGDWGFLSAMVYRNVVAKGMGPLYDRLMQEAVPKQPDGAFLVDLGCGDGRFARRLADRFPSCEVLGIDLAASMVQRAAMANHGVPNLRFRVGDIMAVPLKQSQAQLVVSLASIKHWPDRLQGLREMSRILKPGGLCCILEVDRRCTQEEAEQFVSYWHYVMPGARGLVAKYFREVVSEQSLDAGSLRKTIKAAGFKRVAVDRSSDLPFLVATAKRR